MTKNIPTSKDSVLDAFNSEIEKSYTSAQAVGNYEDKIAQIEFQGKKFSDEEAKVWLSYIDAMSDNNKQVQVIYEKALIS